MDSLLPLPMPLPPSLSTLPDEVILAVLELLDVPELYALTKTSHRFRTLSTDPLLHLTRLKSAKRTLSMTLPRRPTLSDMQLSGRLLTRRQVAQRALARSLTLIRLKRKLMARPSLPVLVERGVMPEQGGMGIAPGLVATVRGLEMERVKDRLRGWVVGGRPTLEDAERGGWVVVAGEEVVEEGGRGRVRDMARRFARRWSEGEGGGGGGGGRERWGQRRVLRYDPPRAHVLELKMHYERLARGC